MHSLFLHIELFCIDTDEYVQYFRSVSGEKGGGSLACWWLSNPWSSARKGKPLCCSNRAGVIVRSEHVYRKHVRVMSASLCVMIMAWLMLTKATVSQSVWVYFYWPHPVHRGHLHYSSESQRITSLNTSLMCAHFAVLKLKSERS